eukprot:TRINITY_DN53680_c0_g1_i1.p1 TRINITY_DN53680_c0_g1~~TRINITY_DN53680_c0_g1_i1.p1  ORF type:complete len:216 (+),score=47.96 TRINITY_DN53680_c0_g1_i1:63-710(+)
MPSLKLHWWNAPGRGAEPSRLALAMKGIEFTDVRYDFSEKDKAVAARGQSPFKQFPMLEVDGKIIAQSNTIMRYVAKLTDLMPQDPLHAAEVESVLDFLAMDIEPLALCSHLQGDEKLQARKAAAEEAGSSFHERLAVLDGYLANMPKDKLTIADLKVFCETSTMISGFYDGFPTDAKLFAPYSHIQAVRARVSNEPAVKAYYAEKTGFYEAFKA